MALAGLETTTGTTIYVSTDPLSSYGATDYAGITWTKVVGVVTFPEWGDTYQDVTEALVAEGRTYHASGSADGGTGTINIQHRDEDAGRELLESALGTSTDVHFLKVYRSGDGEARTGRVQSQMQRPVEQNSVRGQSMNAAFNTAIAKLDDTQTSTATGGAA